MSDFIPFIAGVLGGLLALGSGRLPKSGVAALGGQGLGLFGYYLIFTRC